MDKLDPVKNGSDIFLKIFDDFGLSEITELPVLEKFLNRLLEDMEGWVIFDFLDLGNWDCFGSFSIDYKSGFVFFNWHYYTGTNDFLSYIDERPHDNHKSSIMVHFKDLQINNNSAFPFITIRGFSIKENEALKYFKSIDPKTKHHKQLSKNFYNIYEVDHGTYIEDCYCLNTPIYSILVIPKNTADSSDYSSKILFLYNYCNCAERILKIKNSVLTGNLDEDELCGMANSIRRIFEFVLKIECCYNTILNFGDTTYYFKNNYSDILLGELISKLKKIKNQEEITFLNQVVRLCNELSHDSGKKVSKEKIMKLIADSMKYTNALITAIKQD